jgi:hypothetical protein
MKTAGVAAGRHDPEEVPVYRWSSGTNGRWVGPV